MENNELKKEPKWDKTRCNLYIPTDIVKGVDELASQFGANRSVMVSIMLKTYLDQQEIVKLSKLAAVKENQE